MACVEPTTRALFISCFLATLPTLANKEGDCGSFPSGQMSETLGKVKTVSFLVPDLWGRLVSVRTCR